MAVIKSHSAATLLKDAVVLDLGDLQREARRLRERAEAQADAIVAEARRQASERSAQLEAQANSILAEARQQGGAKGHAEGLAAGLEQGRQQGLDEVAAELRPRGEQLVQSLAGLVEQFDGARQLIEHEAKRAVVELASRLAERLVHRVIETDPMVVVDQISAALEHVLRPLDVTIRLHPDDRQMLEQVAPQMPEAFARARHVTWQDDAAMARGGCVLTYGRGRIDASIETQLRRAAAMLAPPSREGEAVEGGKTKADGGDE